MAKLTGELRDDIIHKVIKDRFAGVLREQLQKAREQVIDLITKVYKDSFDYDHVKPYEAYINWHNEICVDGLPREWPIHWDNVKAICELPSIMRYEVPFKIPSKEGEHCTIFFDSKYTNPIINILRPVMEQYFIAKTVHEDLCAVLSGLNTYQQVRDIIPELSAYLPDKAAEVSRALIPIEQINRIKKAIGNNQGGNND